MALIDQSKARKLSSRTPLFEGFTSLNPNLAVSSKYNTLPARQIAIIESVYNNQEQAPLINTPKSILVKKEQSWKRYYMENCFVMSIFMGLSWSKGLYRGAVL